jgi:N-acetyl-alpha-D-muramate 1-phosphate uridylyltransferase
MLPVAILAGGLATRLRPLTESIPKSLVDVNGEPFIMHQLRLLSANGIERVVLCAGYLGEMIQEYIGAADSLGVQVDFSFDGDRLLGTAGAIKQALPLLGNAFFVLYGDSFLPCDYFAIQRTFLSCRKKALMTVFRNAGKWDSSNVEFQEGQILAYDKEQKTERMRHIDYGLGMFVASTFDRVPEGQFFDLADLYRLILAAGELAAFEVTQRFYEVGSFEGIEELRQFLSHNQ